MPRAVDRTGVCAHYGSRRRVFVAVVEDDPHELVFIVCLVHLGRLQHTTAAETPAESPKAPQKA